MFVYMFSGFCAGDRRAHRVSQLVASHPATGETFELNAIAAAVLGGTSMSGGRGRIGGTIVGRLRDRHPVRRPRDDGVSSFWQTVIKGLVIIAAVVGTSSSNACSSASPCSVRRPSAADGRSAAQ